MTIPIYQHVLNKCVKAGITEFCICPGSRNSPFIKILMASPSIVKHFSYEERSAAFFALGRTRESGKPVAVVTTSGTAVGELLPAAMEAYYTEDPLLLITADRPKRFRGTGAPQAAEQAGIFGVYASFAQDIAHDEACLIGEWNWTGPAHLNVCIEDPKSYPEIVTELSVMHSNIKRQKLWPEIDFTTLKLFFERSRSPLIIVGALASEEQPAVREFLLRASAPIYCEGASGLREDPQLEHLQVRTESAIWQLSEQKGYPIDGVLRFGGIPVTRLWRDLEERSGQLSQCSLSSSAFSGLSYGCHIKCNLSAFLPTFTLPADWIGYDASKFLDADKYRQTQIDQLFEAFPTSEQALYRAISVGIPKNSLVYLGNSLPVREWDLAAVKTPKAFHVTASRGLNGIDGQISTFLGLCTKVRDNWAIVGDLTALYDFAALWMVHKLPEIPLKIIVMNNGGGKLFARIYKDPIFQQNHTFNFEHFAKNWRIPYLRSDGCVPETSRLPNQVFVEICPDEKATEAFWMEYDALSKRRRVI